MDFILSCSILSGNVQVTPEDHRRELTVVTDVAGRDPMHLGLGALAEHARKTLAQIKAKKADEVRP